MQVEWAKADDELFFNTGVEFAELQKAFDYYRYIKKDPEIK